MHPTPLGRAAAVAAAAAALLLTPPAAAQDPEPAPVTWGVVPSSADGPDGRAAFDYKLDPGAELTDHVAVSNHSTTELTLSVYASDAFTTADGGFDLLPAAEEATDVGSWVTVDVPEVTIPARSRVHVPFHLRVPDNATPGDHAGGVVAALGSTGSQDGDQVLVEHRVGARIYLRVTGELDPQFTVEQLEMDYRGTWHPFRGGTLTATYTVRNTGNVRLAGEPVLTTTGPFGLGRQSSTGEPLPEILPGSELTTTVRASGVPPLIRVSATAGMNPVAADGAPLTTTPTVTPARSAVWALPWPQATLLLLAAVGIAGWWWQRRRRRRKTAALIAAAREEGRQQATKGRDATTGGQASTDADASTDTAQVGGERAG